MSEALSMGLGVVVGGAIAASYTKTLDSVEARAKQLGERWQRTNRRLKAAGSGGPARRMGEGWASMAAMVRGRADAGGAGEVRRGVRRRRRGAARP